MSKGVTASGMEYEVIHRLSDGTVLDDITGVVARVNEHTIIGYRMMLKFAMRAYEKEIAELEELEKLAGLAETAEPAEIED